MYRFLGILLRISLNPVDAGGYPSYFNDKDITVSVSADEQYTIPGSKGFMASIPEKYRMSLNRFKQIRGAFHPEDKILSDQLGDKCYMLRSVINELNRCSLRNFVPEGNLSFDEGGIACRSRYCPVRQYNKDKPDKFRVDFFILAGSASRIIYNVDVYQGKNASNVGIAKEFHNLPTTMKVVLNAVLQTKLCNDGDDVDGYRVLSLDNRYQCPQLAYLLWNRYVLTIVACYPSSFG